jgi:RNA polymerase sigma-70 factor (ECF subfamily)
VQSDLERLLSTLPTEQREVLLLHQMQGFSYAQIAEMTGATEVGVKQKAYRALKTLKSQAKKGTAQS